MNLPALNVRVSDMLDALEAGVDSFEHGYFLNDEVFRKMREKGGAPACLVDFSL